MDPRAFLQLDVISVHFLCQILHQGSRHWHHAQLAVCGGQVHLTTLGFHPVEPQPATSPAGSRPGVGSLGV